MKIKNIEQLDILDLVNCAEDYGHSNDVCLHALYTWAQPIEDEDIEKYINSLKNEDGYGDEDRNDAKNRLTEWRDKFQK